MVGTAEQFDIFGGRSKMEARTHGICSAKDAGEIVCWTKMQAEAGQQLSAIIHRKEAERQSGNGVFFWGIGNSLGRTVDTLRKRGGDHRLIFSKMLSAPKPADSAPSSTCLWLGFIDFDGQERELPEHVLVTSRASTSSRPKTKHYALVCRSHRPIAVNPTKKFDHRAYRNAGGTGAPVGPSQVTTLLVRSGNENLENASYNVDMEASLVAPYAVTLTRPVIITLSEKARIEDWSILAPSEWANAVKQLKLAALKRANLKPLDRSEAEPRMAL